jgi:ElaB/YqjD/DUF883 family membrane-anchored ribosome-binding protein
MAMADKKSDALPEGTDKIVTGASGGPAKTRTLVPEREVAAAESRLAERVRTGADKLSSQAGEKARGLVGQGLERSAEALANVSKLVGDTAPGIEERLGSEYGDYARRAASAIETTANAIAGKDPDELIDDTRNFVRNSPGLALAGAAIVGFVVARLFKTGLARDDNED